MKFKKIDFVKTQELSKTTKIHKLGPKNCTIPPILGMENLSNRMLQHTVRITSMLFMHQRSFFHQTHKCGC